MTLRKRYSKDQSVCRVRFLLEKELCPNAKTVHLVGEFNEWNQTATPMRRLKNGSFSITLMLKTGREYQYRYLINGILWETDWRADKSVLTVFGHAENSVLVI